MWAFGPLTPDIIHHLTLRLHLLYLPPYIIISLTDTFAFMALSAPRISNLMPLWIATYLPLWGRQLYFWRYFLVWERFLKIYQPLRSCEHPPSLNPPLLFQLYGQGVDVWISQDVTLMLCKSCSPPLTFLRWRYKNLIISFGNRMRSLFSPGLFETGIDWWSVRLPPQ